MIRQSELLWFWFNDTRLKTALLLYVMCYICEVGEESVAVINICVYHLFLYHGAYTFGTVQFIYRCDNINGISISPRHRSSACPEYRTRFCLHPLRSLPCSQIPGYGVKLNSNEIFISSIY